MVQIPDLMTLLEQEYENYLQSLEGKPDEYLVTEEDGTINVAKSFSNFCRQYLATLNQPIQVSYLTVGLGLRLQAGQTVAFANQSEETSHMRDEGVHITKPKTVPGMHGLVPSHSIGIFGRA
jgi:hypothetical protein